MREISLNQGKSALVDDADFEVWGAVFWTCAEVRINGRSYGFYVRARIKGRRVLMHRVIMGASRTQLVDHIDGNPLNNQRANLRVASHAQNMANRRRFVSSTGFKGVALSRRSKTNPFEAVINSEGKRFRLGRFPTAELAAQAYDRAAIKIHGEFACTNASIAAKNFLPLVNP